MKRQMLGLGIATLTFALFLSACDSGKKSGGGDNKTGTTNQCAAGQVWIAQYNGCFSTAQCPVPPNPVNSGYVPQVGQCIQGTPGGTTPATNGHMWSGDLYITNWDQYQQLMKDNNVCGHPFNSGIYDCANWSNYATFQLDIYGNTIPATGAQTRASVIAYQNGYYGTAYRIMPFQGLSLAADNNTTIQMQTTGSFYAYNDFFRMIARPANQPIPYTNLKAITQMRVDVLYKGVTVGFTDVTLRW